MYTLPKTNSKFATPKNGFPQVRNLLFQRSIFRCYVVSFRESSISRKRNPSHTSSAIFTKKTPEFRSSAVIFWSKAQPVVPHGPSIPPCFIAQLKPSSYNVSLLAGRIVLFCPRDLRCSQQDIKSEEGCLWLLLLLLLLLSFLSTHDCEKLRSYIRISAHLLWLLRS